MPAKMREIGVHGFVAQDSRLLVDRPPKWSHAEAAALPTVFTTVDMALGELACLQAGIGSRGARKPILGKHMLWGELGSDLPNLHN